MPNDADMIIPEADFQATVVEMAESFKWTVHFTRDSRRGRTGFPDVFLARPPVAMLVELKTERGRLRPGFWSKAEKWNPGQNEWLELLGQCTEFRSGLWRPSQLDAIEELLRQTAGEVTHG